MVCSVDHLASAAGVDVLRDGGSAVDAALAANAVLAVTTQHQCGMGGDLFAIVHDGPGPPAVLNASGRAGSGVDAAALRDEGHAAVPFRGDVRAATVPGCVDGWVALHERFGRLPLPRVLAAAVGYARHGFPASPLLVATLGQVDHLPEAADYLAGGRPRVGTLVRRPSVADALEGIGAGGRDAFYGGAAGQDLLDVGGGLFSEADLARSQADWVEPLAVDAMGHRLWTVPPNSQGYLTLAGAWIADGLPLPDDDGDPLWAHLTAEAARWAAHDRPAVLWEGADGDALVSAERLGPRRAAIDPDGVTSPTAPAGAGDTMYLCTVDDRRQAVSLIQSNAGGWGAGIGLPRTRIFLHNRGVGFSLEPGHPAELGPGRRPPHTLSPALVTTTADELVAAVGTMGGDGQPQFLLQVLDRLLRLDQDPATAVAAGRWTLSRPDSSGFDTWNGSARLRTVVEGHAPAGWDDGLAARGHDVRRVRALEHLFGHAHTIRVDDDALVGASDPRTLVGAAQGW